MNVVVRLSFCVFHNFILFHYNINNKMTQYNSLNVKVSNSQLNKLKSGIKNDNEVTFKPSSNVVGDSNDENSFPHKLSLTNPEVLKLRKAFENNASANIKLSKTQLHIIEK